MKSLKVVLAALVLGLGAVQLEAAKAMARQNCSGWTKCVKNGAYCCPGNAEIFRPSNKKYYCKYKTPRFSNVVVAPFEACHKSKRNR